MLRRFLIAVGLTLLGSAATAAPGASLNNPNVPTGEGDAIFAVGEQGALEPIAVRTHGTFLKPGSNEGAASDKLRMEANASILTHGSRVHVVFGRRTIATTAATVENGAASATVPATLHLGGYVGALASPTLGGHAASPRRAPTAAERAAALAAAAAALGNVPLAKLQVRNLTAIDLGRGTAIAGTVFVDGASTTRRDKHLFFIAERTSGTLRLTLSNGQTMQSNPELRDTGEALIDAIDLAPNAPAVVTRILGYDAHTFAIYTRSPSGTWKQIYTGGGIAV